MIYLEFLSALNNYKLSVEAVEQILDEKLEIFQLTQPKSSVQEAERVDGGTPKKKQEEYVILLEQKNIGERLKIAKDIMHDRWELLQQKEVELRHSNLKYDKIYCLKYLDGADTREIARKLHYSESHVYRIINKLEKMIENDRK